MDLQLIGYWRNDEHPEYPDPHDLVDPDWDERERFAVELYFKRGTYLRLYMGPSPCRFCGRHNGVSEYTDGVLLWPEGLAHYIQDHEVRLPATIVQYVLDRLDRLEATTASVDWWVQGAPQPAEPLEPPVRLVWAGNTQLLLQPGRRFPGLMVQGDTLSSHVDGTRSAELLKQYEDLMAAAGQPQLPYPST